MPRIGEKLRAIGRFPRPLSTAVMMKTSVRNHYIIKHNLEALEALPNFIWNSAARKEKPPKWFRHVKKGDRWISFAHTSTDNREERLSLITGLYECIREARYGKLTPRAQAEARHKHGAWLIEGRPLRIRIDHPIAVPPIDAMLKRRAFNQTTFVPISAIEFYRIKQYVKDHRFDPATIPLYGREPQCEQEILSLVTFAHKQLGIERILRARTRFPDMLVKLKGKRQPVHLELEVYSKSFLIHGHHLQVGREGMFTDMDEAVGRKPVGVLCWIDDDKHSPKTRTKSRVQDYVQRVFELQSLIRENKRIRW